MIQNRFVPAGEEKGRLLKKYWTVPGCRIEISVVLADSKESKSFFARPIRFNHRNRLHGVRTENDAFREEHHEHDHRGDEKGHHPYQHPDRRA
jgi:hypothetical protein